MTKLTVHTSTNWLFLFALLGLQVILYFYMGSAGMLEFRIVNDSRSYLLFGFDDIETIFSQTRTFGYPLFLKIYAMIFGENLSFLPTIQFIVYQFSVLMLYWTFCHVGVKRGLAIAFSTPLVFALVGTTFSGTVLSELLGATSLLFVFSIYLCALHKKTLKWLFLLSIAVFLSYQVRPSNLFIIPLIPVVTLCFGVFKSSPRQATFILFTKMCLVVSIPFLINCGYRYAKFDSFSPVSFSGMNFIGIAASMINEGSLAKLPYDQRNLARLILSERQARNMQPYPELSSAKTIMNERSRLQLSRQQIYDTSGTQSQMLKWYAEHDINNWRLAIPIYIEMMSWNSDSIDWVRMDRDLSNLSFAVFKTDFGGYFKWIAFGMAAAIYKLLFGFKLALPLLVANVAVISAFVLGKKKLNVSIEWNPMLTTIICYSVLSFIFSIGLTSLTQPPRFRYLVNSGLLIESALACILVWLVLPYIKRAR